MASSIGWLSFLAINSLCIFGFLDACAGRTPARKPGHGPRAPGWWKVFRLYAWASAANDLGAVPQLLARLPQPTVLAGQTHQVGPQAHFGEAGAECGAHPLKGKQAESGMVEFLTGRVSFGMFSITVLSSKLPPPPPTQNQRTSSVKIGHRSRSSAIRDDARHRSSLNPSSSPVYLISFLFFCFPWLLSLSERAEPREMKASQSKRVLGGARFLSGTFAADPH